VLTIACLVPFSGKAFHIDDPLFIWTARQITQHPLNPFGFRLVWGDHESPMTTVSSNPPLASYYIAVVGLVAGWSEPALHAAFVLPALVVVLGTYRLAQRFTTLPFLAALTALFTPVFLISATTVMTDTMMLAFWVAATILWVEGLDPVRPALLLSATLLLGACFATKYFGGCFCFLLIAYSLLKKRSVGAWVWYFAVPALIFLGYDLWAHATFGHALLGGVAGWAIYSQVVSKLSLLGKGVVALVFVGGCILPALLYTPLLWSRLQIFVGILVCGFLALSIAAGWLNVGYLGHHWTLIAAEAAIYFGGGLSLIALCFRDCRRGFDKIRPAVWWHCNTDSLFLMMWIFGTVAFAALVNWTINGRSILPAIPAASILLARQLERVRASSDRLLLFKQVTPLVLSGAMSLWIASGDAALANAQRSAATLIYDKIPQNARTVWFEGHWGFHYYMQSLGAKPAHIGDEIYRAGDIFVIPENNTNILNIPPSVFGSAILVTIEGGSGVTTSNPELGAGFYASRIGPLPFAIGDVPPEHFYITRIVRSFRLTS